MSTCKDRKEFFYEDGTLKTVITEEMAILYWPNGKIKRKCTFQNGVRHGLDQMWDSSGNLVDEDRYEHGNKI